MRSLLVLGLLVIIAIKAVAVIALGPVPIEQDAAVYWRMSTLVLGGDWLMMAEPIAYRTPVYPWFLAAIRAFAGSYSLVSIVVAQSILMVGSIWIAGQIASKVTRLPGAMVWTLALSLPAFSAFTFNAALLSESLFTFLLMLHLLSVLIYDEEPSASRAVFVGVTFALTLLTRPIVILLWLIHIPLMLWSHWRRRRRVGKDASLRVKLPGRVAHGVLAGVVAVAMVAPWVIRNSILFDEMFVTQFVGRNIWVVTFQDGSGAGLEVPDTEAGRELQRRIDRVAVGDEDWILTWTVSHGLIRSGMNDSQADQLMQRVSLDAIGSNQSVVAYKTFRRTCNFWRAAATELPAQGIEGSYRGQKLWKYSIPVIDAVLRYRLSQSVWLNTLVTVLILAACVLLIFNRPSRPYAVWLLLILGYFCVITGVFEIPHYRYRMVVEPLATAVCGAAIAVLLSRRRKPAAVVASS